MSVTQDATKPVLLISVLVVLIVNLVGVQTFTLRSKTFKETSMLTSAFAIAREKWPSKPTPALKISALTNKSKFHWTSEKKSEKETASAKTTTTRTLKGSHRITGSESILLSYIDPDSEISSKVLEILRKFSLDKLTN